MNRLFRIFLISLLTMTSFATSAMAESYDIEFYTTQVTSEPDPNKGNYCFAFYSEDGNWKMQLDYYADSMYGTHPTAEFRLKGTGKNYNYIRNAKKDTEFYQFSNVELTVTEGNGVINLEAFCTTTNNMKVHVTGSIEKPAIVETINVNLGKASIVWDDFYKTSVIEAANEQYTLAFGIIGQIAEGTYYIADLLQPELILLPNDSIMATDATLEVTSGSEEGSYDMLLQLISNDKQYSITMTYTKPSMDVNYTKELTLTNTQLNDLSGSYGLYQIYGECEEYKVALCMHLEIIDESRTEFTDEDISLVRSGILRVSDGQSISILTAKGTINEDEKAIYVHADMLGSDNVLYKCTFVFPKKQDEGINPDGDDIKINFANHIVTMDYTLNDPNTGNYNVGLGMAFGDYQLKIHIKDYLLEGNYNTQDLDLYNSYLVKINNTAHTYSVHDITDGQVYAEKSDDNTNLTIRFTTTEGQSYYATATLTYKKALDTEEEFYIDLDMADDKQFMAFGEGEEELPDGCPIQLAMGVTEDGELISDGGCVLNFYPYITGDKTKIEGTYGFSEGTMANAYPQYITESGTEIRFIPIAGTLSIKKAGSIDIYLEDVPYTTALYDITVRMLGNNGVIYNAVGRNYIIFVDANYNLVTPTAIKSLKEELAKQGLRVRKVLNNGKIMIECDGKKYNTNGVVSLKQ